jgi:hypothetical protein
MTTQPTNLPWMPKAEPHFPPWGSGDPEIVMAIRAWKTGTANAGQQQLAWAYMMFITGASEDFADLSYRSDEKGGRRATDFAEGKRFIGLMIRKLLRPEFTPKPQAQTQPPSVAARIRKRATQKSL